MNLNIEELYAGPEQKTLVEQATAAFKDAFDRYILPVEGGDALAAYLAKTDFYTAPASTKYHGAHPGGLVIHSVNVYNRLSKLAELEKQHNDNPKIQGVSDESIAKVALLHDLCKIDVYKVGTRNVKDANGVWNTVPYYQYEDSLPYGHGEKSVYIITGFIKLTRDEAMAVRWHMGAFDDSVKGGGFGSSTLGTAFEMHPLSLLLHQADQSATHFDEN